MLFGLFDRWFQVKPTDESLNSYRSSMNLLDLPGEVLVNIVNQVCFEPGFQDISIEILTAVHRSMNDKACARFARLASSFIMSPLRHSTHTSISTSAYLLGSNSLRLLLGRMLACHTSDYCDFTILRQTDLAVCPNILEHFRASYKQSSSPSVRMPSEVSR